MDLYITKEAVNMLRITVFTIDVLISFLRQLVWAKALTGNLMYFFVFCWFILSKNPVTLEIHLAI